MGLKQIGKEKKEEHEEELLIPYYRNRPLMLLHTGAEMQMQ
jgi:hypothetical protein